MTLLDRLVGVDDDGPPKPPKDTMPTKREAERLVFGAILEEIRALRQNFTEYAGRLEGRIVNDVLGVETAQFDANATPIVRRYHAAVGAVAIDNLSAHTMTVEAREALSGSSSGIGVGTYVVPANSHRVINVASRSFSIFGTAGDTLSFQAFSAGATPRAT